jgi:hypothetical protein
VTMPATRVAIPRLLVHELGWWLAGAGRLWWRHKLRTSAHVLLTVIVWLERWELVLLILVGPVVGLALWARLGPVSYARRIRGPLSRWGLRRDLLRSWPVIMESVGLARRTPATVRRCRFRIRRRSRQRIGSRLPGCGGSAGWTVS